VFLPGCSRRAPEIEKPKNEKKDLERVQALYSQLRQLDASVLRARQDVAAQQSRLDALQRDLGSVQKTLSDLGVKTVVPPSETGTAAGQPLQPPTREQIAAAKAEKDKRKKAKDDAEHSTLSAFLIVCFLAVVFVFGYRLWKKRDEETEDSQVDSPFAGGPDNPPAPEKPAEEPKPNP
jgi:hypothetical protein